jgi:hypothetical protein
MTSKNTSDAIVGRIAEARRKFILLFLLPWCMQLPAQVAEHELTAELLTRLGVYLPQGRSIQQQMKYQAAVATHDQVNLVWHSVPGMKGMVEQDELYSREVRSPDAISVVSIKRNLAEGGACPCGLLLRDDSILILGLSSPNEIRSIALLPDFRIGQLEGAKRYFADGDFHVRLPPDSSISQVKFATIRLNNGSWVLTTIGDIPLKETK